MSADPTEALRRRQCASLNASAADRDALRQRYPQVWDPQELRRDFLVLGFQAPYVVVRRRRDGVLGSLAFQHEPRFYFDWREDGS